MAGPMSVPTTGNINSTGFTTLFDAFKKLTVDRAENRGTLEAVKDGAGKVVELKCSQHHFLSGKVQATTFNSTELRGLLKNAVSQDLTLFNLKLKDDLAGSNSGVTGSQTQQLDKKLNDLKAKIEGQFADVFEKSDKALLRKDINKVIVKIDDIKSQFLSMSIDELLSCDLEKRFPKAQPQAQEKVAVQPQAQEKVVVQSQAQERGSVQEQPLELDEALADISRNIAKIHNAKTSKKTAEVVPQRQPQSIGELSDKIFEGAPDLPWDSESESESSQPQEKVSVQGQPLNLNEVGNELPDDIFDNVVDLSRESEPSVNGKPVAPLAGAEVPESKEFTDDDMAQVNEIASFAYGSSEKSSGGEGYMGVYNGHMTKFLTHHGERKNVGQGLTDDLKKLISDSTAELRAKLLQLAGKLEDGQEKGEILRLLAKNEKTIADHNGLDLLSRKDVAKVVTLLAKGAQKAGKSIFSWKDVKPAATVKDTTLETVLFGSKEIRQAEAKAISALSQPAYKKNKDFVEFLADPVKVATAAAEIDQALKDQGLKSAIIDCRSVDLTQKNPVRNLKQQFSFSGQYTAETAQTLMAAGNEKICMQLYADGHYFACGLPQAWGTQEESVLADTFDPKMAAWMLKHGFITKTVTEFGFRYEYSGLSTVGGGYLLNDPLSGKCYSFFSMPSLTNSSDSFDLRGNVNWLCEARRMKTGKEMTAEQRANATKFISKFYDRTKNGSVQLNSDQYCMAMKYLLFAGDDVNFNVFAHQKDADVEKEIDKFLAFVDATNKKDPKALEKVAQPAYEYTVGTSIAKLIATAFSLGVKNFIGGPIGCGVFMNAYKDVAGFVKKALEGYAGDMKYIYPGNESNADIEGTKEKAFREVIVGD